MIFYMNDNMGMSFFFFVVDSILEWKRKGLFFRVYLILLRVFVISICNFYSESMVDLF